jgi:type IV pilus assembly protein PilC
MAIYKVGHETGDVNMILPVAQENHRENGESVFSGLIYHVIVLSIAVMIVGILMTYVIPKFKAIFADMLEPGEVLPEFTMLVLKISDTIKNNAAALFIPLLLLLGVWFYCKKKGWLDAFWLLMPWRRKRLQRDYSRVLALLLDSGVPEEKAIELAAQSTSNRTIKKRARKVIAGLQSGMGLTEAIKLMDDSREFQWRLTNALQTDGKFVDSLSGWHQSLSARADRQHRSFASLIEATMILLLGLIIGSIMIGMFLPLIKLMDKLTY